MSGVRKTRRHVRLHGSLMVGSRTYEVFTRNLSQSGVYLLVRGASAEGLEAEQGIRLRFEMPEGPVIDSPGKIAWLETADLDHDGASALGLGVELAIEDPRIDEALIRFVEEFRYLVVIAGSSAESRARVTNALAGEYAVLEALSADEVVSIMARREIAIVLVLADVGGVSAIEVFERVSAALPLSHATRVVMSAELDVAMLRRLVNDASIFRSWPDTLTLSALLEGVREAADWYALRAENARLAGELERTKRWLERENTFLRQRLTGIEGFDKIIGHSQQLKHSLQQLERVRRTDAPVHITGETGTGKELAARALHSGGARAERPYVVQNCAGMTETLLQSTLFGHRKGAFTGADRDHRGVFLEADGGTLFLDEVGELSAGTQAMLLRAVQEGEIMPVGATRPMRVDVRIISATHKDLREEVKAGRFREDLYYRLVVVTVRMPSLRERRGDVMLLARHFLDLHCAHYGKDIPGFRLPAVTALEAYAWPGNVRELDNEIERMVILGDEREKIDIAILSPHILENVAPRASSSGAISSASLSGLSYDAAVEQVERTLIEAAFAAGDGSVTKAAERLGIERSRLGKIRKRLGLSV